MRASHFTAHARRKVELARRRDIQVRRWITAAAGSSATEAATATLVRTFHAQAVSITIDAASLQAIAQIVAQAVGFESELR